MQSAARGVAPGRLHNAWLFTGLGHCSRASAPESVSFLCATRATRTEHFARGVHWFAFEGTAACGRLQAVVVAAARE